MYSEKITRFQAKKSVIKPLLFGFCSCTKNKFYHVFETKWYRPKWRPKRWFLRLNECPITCRVYDAKIVLLSNKSPSDLIFGITRPTRVNYSLSSDPLKITCKFWCWGLVAYVKNFRWLNFEELSMSTIYKWRAIFE